MGWILFGVIAVTLVALLAYGGHRVLLWAESRGWVYYKKTSPPHGAGALAMQELAQIYEPQAEHVIEATRSQAIVADHEESGDAPPGEIPESASGDGSV